LKQRPQLSAAARLLIKFDVEGAELICCGAWQSHRSVNRYLTMLGQGATQVGTSSQADTAVRHRMSDLRVKLVPTLTG
jgi:hypothetical protein